MITEIEVTCNTASESRAFMGLDFFSAFTLYCYYYYYLLKTHGLQM